MTKKLIFVLLIAIALLLPFAMVRPVPQVEAIGARPEVFTLNSTVITSATTWNGPSVMGQHENIDIFVEVDQTDINTLTLTLQVSPDNSTWVNHSSGSAILTNNTADATSATITTVQGVYYRITSTHGNTNEVTPTIQVVLR